MRSRKTLAWFFVKVAVIYGVLLLPWPGLRSGYQAALCRAGNTFFRTIGDALVTFRPMEAPTLLKDTEIELKNIRTGRKGIMEIAARRTFLAAAFTAALIAAAPIGWRRKLWALPLGLVLFGGYVGLGVWLRVIFGLSEPGGLAAIELAPWLRTLVLSVTKVLSMSPVTPYIAALVVCVLVTVRREDVAGLAHAASGSPSLQRASARA